MFETQHLQNTTLLCHPAYKDELTQQWFDANYWQQQDKIVGAKKVAQQRGFLNINSLQAFFATIGVVV